MTTRLNDYFNVRPWQYTATPAGYVSPNNRRRHFINEHLTGAMLGEQKPARITFRMALWVVHGWNQLGTTRYRLVIPNEP